MKLLTCRDVDIRVEDKFLFHIDSLDIESGDRVALTGLNGSGKTSFLHAIRQEEQKGIKRDGIWVFQEQFQNEKLAQDPKFKSLWEISDLEHNFEKHSGGEKMRDALSYAFSVNGEMYVFDEPTSNLDAKGISKLKEMLWSKQSFLIVSHDRELLDELTNRTLVIKDGELIDFAGNYSEYKLWEQEEEKRRWAEYKNYKNELSRLQLAANNKKEQARKTQKKPKGKSASEIKQAEYGAVGKSIGGKYKSLSAQAKHIEKRIEQLEVKERPKQVSSIRPDFHLTSPPQNRIIIQSERLNVSFGDRVLFEEACFHLGRGEKVALTGENGSGKSTLLSLIETKDPQIYLVPKAKLGVFKQGMEHLDLHKSVYENLVSVSIQSPTVNRGVLDRVGFSAMDLDKKAGVLSGGERVKLSFAMLCVADVNVLVLDEPTNFLDLNSIEAIEHLLRDYEGTILFVSHDARFIQNLATAVWQIKDKKIKVL